MKTTVLILTTALATVIGTTHAREPLPVETLGRSAVSAAGALWSLTGIRAPWNRTHIQGVHVADVQGRGAPAAASAPTVSAPRQLATGRHVSMVQGRA